MFARKLLKKRLLRRFAKAKRGTAALEFALIAMPFFLLMFGLAEISMIGFAQSSLDYAVSETARQIRTGQAQNGGVTYDQIRSQLCTEANRFVVLTCDNLFLDVNRFTSFVDAGNQNNSPIQNDEFQTDGFGYNPGVASDIVVVRAYYRWQVMTPMFEPVFESVSGGQRILVSTMMFRNEPF